MKQNKERRINMAKNNKIIKNTTWLMIFYIAKMVFPFITLPYLTRILSTNTYGTVAYVKTVMTYMQIIVDFGFVLSATKDIVKVRNDKNIVLKEDAQFIHLKFDKFN